jgi:integrase
MRLKGCSIFKPHRRRKPHHPYLIAVRVPGKSAQVVTGSTDYDDTRELAERLSRLTQRIALGMADTVELRREVERCKPLTKHLNDYERHQIATGKTKKHALQMRLCAEQALEHAKTIDEVVSSKVQQKIGSMDVSGTTKNRHLYSVRSFIKWGVDDNRWPRECLERLRLVRLPQTRTYRRRVLPLTELAALVRAAEQGPTIRNTTGAERALIYRTMLTSGLRLGEIRSLRVEWMTADGLHLPPQATKNRKEARVALPPAIARQLHEHAAGKLPGDRVFYITSSNPDRLLKADLKSAGISRKTAAGVFDFHSLRHQCATILAAAGAPAKAIQSHMRHGSIKLTLDTYGHLFDADRRRTADVLGNVVQRLAQRSGEPMSEQIPDFRAGEVEPRGIEPRFAECDSDALLYILSPGNGLTNKRKRRVAPGAAPRLLRRLFVRAEKRRSGGAR